MTLSGAGNNLHRRFLTKVPFGLNSATPFSVETDADSFSLELRDACGAPILRLAIDTDNGDIWLEAIGTKQGDHYALGHITLKNRQKVE